MNKVIFLGAFLVLAFEAAAISKDEKHHLDGVEGEPLKPDSLFHLDSNWVADDGKGFKLRQLSGSPTVVAMIYTSCKAACPMIIEDMKKIQRNLPDNLKTEVRFLGVSLDSKHDTPSVLKEFKTSHALDAHWTLIKGEASAVRGLAAALSVQYKRVSSTDIQHSFLVTVLNKSGSIVFQQNGLGHDPQAAVKSLESAAAKDR